MKPFKTKQFFIFFAILLLSVSVVSAGLWDLITGKVTSEPSIADILDEGETKTYTLNGVAYEVTADFVGFDSTKGFNGSKFSINGELTTLIGEADSYILSDGKLEIKVIEIVSEDVAGGVRQVEFTLSVDEKNADYFFAVDDYSPAEDILLMQGIISNLQLDFPTGNVKLNSEISRVDLSNRVTTFIYKQNVLIIVGDTSPSEHVIFAQKISNYLKGRGINSIQKLSSKITNDDLTKEIESKCTDSDGGKDHSIMGKVCIEDECYWDTNNYPLCLNCQPYLTEYYCDNGVIRSEDVTCEEGYIIGSYGACVKEYPDCSETDGGFNIYEKGDATGIVYGSTYTDSCQDNVVLYEYYCGNKYESLPYKMIRCPQGCKDGACAQADHCSDGIFNGDETDVDCGGSCNVCSVGKKCDQNTDCITNICKDGICIKSDIATNKPNQPIDLSNYPNMFISDNKFNGVLVVGDKAPTEDVLSAVDIATSIQYEGKETTTGIAKIEVGTAKLASEITDPLKLNIISVGNPCTNAISAQLMGNPAYCTKGFTKNEGLIKLYNYNGYAQILVAGYSKVDTRKAARVLANWDDYNLRGNEKCVYGSSINPSVKDCGQEEDICTDSDGGVNYYVKGYVEMKDDSSFGTNGRKYDECWNDGKHLSEYVCENGVYKGAYNYICPQGCKDGACIQDSSKILPTFTAAVYDKGPASDVIIISDVIAALKGKGYGAVPVGTSKLFSEVSAIYLDNKVTLAVYLGEAVIIVGEYSPVSHVTFAVDIKGILSKKGITPKTILSSEVPSADLLDLFEEKDEEIEIPEEETQEPIITLTTPIKVEPDKCKTSADCDDNNACTSDLCSGTPKKCSNIEVSLGCNYNGNCVPIGVRVDSNYCDIDRTVKSQLDSSENCNNNYECTTNVCVNNECISQNILQKIIDWFKRLFGG